MQKMNFMMAEVVYRKSQMIDPDANKACNLGLCLIKQARYEDASLVLQDVLHRILPGSDELRSRRRAKELMQDIQSRSNPSAEPFDQLGFDDDFVNGLEQLMSERGPSRSKRLPIFEEITPVLSQLACWICILMEECVVNMGGLLLVKYIWDLIGLLWNQIRYGLIMCPLVYFYGPWSRIRRSSVHFKCIVLFFPCIKKKKKTCTVIYLTKWLPQFQKEAQTA